MKKYIIYFEEHKSRRAETIDAINIDQAITLCKIKYHCKLEDIQHVSELDCKTKEELNLN